MLEDYSKRTCIVIDNGLFVELAVTLAKSFKKVYYYSPWEGPFPKSNSRLIGYGIPGVTRINDFWEVYDEVDLWVFPDIYFGGLQLHLEAQGKRVWGSRKGEELELLRKEAKEYLKNVDVPIGKYKVVIGIDALRDHLKKNDNQWIKVSTTRGDFESFHSKNYKLIEPRLDELEHTLGAKKKIFEFIVEDGIDDAVEVGYDGFSVNGEFPKQAMCGIEIKDKGYIGIFKEYDKMPKQILDLNKKISPALKEYGFKNFFCMEMRITKDGTPWVVDPMTRFGSPPSELIFNMYTNLADIIWFGAEGKLIDPIPADKYGAELLIHSSWADKNWQAIEFPKELRDNIKLRNLAIIDGRYYVVPQSVGLPEIGAVVATGKTIEEASAKVQGYAKEIEGYFIDLFPESMEEANGEIEKLKKFGIEL